MRAVTFYNNNPNVLQEKSLPKGSALWCGGRDEILFFFATAPQTNPMDITKTRENLIETATAFGETISFIAKKPSLYPATVDLQRLGTLGRPKSTGDLFLARDRIG